jgi:hypothetical protein
MSIAQPFLECPRNSHWAYCRRILGQSSNEIKKLLARDAGIDRIVSHWGEQLG